MRSRLVQLIDHVANPRQPWSDMERMTGISRQRWRSAYRGSQRINEDMLEAIAENWPQYVGWLVANNVEISNRQTRPGAKNFQKDDNI